MQWIMKLLKTHWKYTHWKWKQKTHWKWKQINYIKNPWCNYFSSYYNQYNTDKQNLEKKISDPDKKYQTLVV